MKKTYFTSSLLLLISASGHAGVAYFDLGAAERGAAEAQANMQRSQADAIRNQQMQEDLARKQAMWDIEYPLMRLKAEQEYNRLVEEQARRAQQLENQRRQQQAAQQQVNTAPLLPRFATSVTQRGYPETTIKGVIGYGCGGTTGTSCYIVTPKKNRHYLISWARETEWNSIQIMNAATDNKGCMAVTGVLSNKKLDTFYVFDDRYSVIIDKCKK